MFHNLEFHHKKDSKAENHNHWHLNELHVTVLAIAFLVGITLAIPFKLIKEKAVTPSTLGPRQELINEIVTLNNEKDSLKDALIKEREQLGLLEDSLGQKETERKLLSERFREASLLAGLRGVKGHGIVLRLAESAEAVPSGDEASSYIIHQEDLLNITNELWAAGAEAMAIKSGNSIERIVATTAIRCVGPVVQVNNQNMAPPFEIHAIGDPQKMKQALQMPGGVLQPLAFFRITYTIEEKDEIVIPPYSGAVKTYHTQPIEEVKEENSSK